MDKRNLEQSHDLLARHFLNSADLAASLLRHYVDPHVVRALDLDSLKNITTETVDASLGKHQGDFRYLARCRGSDAQCEALILLEHQSRAESLISFRILQYTVKSYEQHLKAGKKRRGRSFPYPLAVVLYNGKDPWRKLNHMPDLIDHVDGLDRDILKVPLFLIDLSEIPTESLQGPPALRALLTSLQTAPRRQLDRHLGAITDMMADAYADHRARDWRFALETYFAAHCDVKSAEDLVQNTFGKFIDKKEAEAMVTTLADRLMRKGRAEGKAEGKAESLITVLEARFGMVPEDLRLEISGMADSAVLNSLTVLALKCENMGEFQKKMRR